MVQRADPERPRLVTGGGEVRLPVRVRGEADRYLVETRHVGVGHLWCLARKEWGEARHHLVRVVEAECLSDLKQPKAGVGAQVGRCCFVRQGECVPAECREHRLAAVGDRAVVLAAEGLHRAAEVRDRARPRDRVRRLVDLAAEEWHVDLAQPLEVACRVGRFVLNPAVGYADLRLVRRIQHVSWALVDLADIDPRRFGPEESREVDRSGRGPHLDEECVLVASIAFEECSQMLAADQALVGAHREHPVRREFLLRCLVRAVA